MEVTGVEGALPPAVIVPGPEHAHGEGAKGLGRLPLGRKMAYGAGQLVEMVVESMLNVFVLFYVTVVCGLPGGLAGLAIGAGIVADAVMSPLIGSLSDGWRSRLGRRVPFMILSLAPILLTFNLMFALPTTLSQTMLFLWLMLLSVCLRIAIALFTLPYQALGVELTDDYDERSSIAAWRWAIGILGTLAVLGLGYGVFLKGPQGVSDRAAYLPLTLTLSGVVLLGALVAIRQGIATRHLQREAEPSSEAMHARLLAEIGEMFRNRTFRVLFAVGLLFNIEVGVQQALALHLSTFFWQLTPGQMQGLSMTAVLGLVLGAPIAARLAQRIEKRTMLLIGMTGLLGAHTVLPSLKLLGLLQLTSSELTSLLAVVGLLGGMMLALSIIAFISIVPDAADEHEHLFGTRREGLYFAGWSFATKTATGAGVLGAGLVLQLIDFPVNVGEQGGAAAIPQRTLEMLAFAGGPGLALFSIVAILLVLLYRINKQSHQQIMTELRERRRAAD